MSVLEVNKIILTIFFIKIWDQYFTNGDEHSQIILSYAPLGNQGIRGQIMIYWFLENILPGDILMVYHDTVNLNFIHLPNNKSGFVKTGISPLHARYSIESEYADQCTGYYGSWLRGSEVKKTTCLSSHANWMYNNRKILKNMTLAQLFVPGSHNSGSYNEELPPTIIQRYTMTQDKSVLDQLLSGIRYLDIRPCIIDNKYWVCHGNFAMQPFDDIINDINDFMDNTMEIVIVNFKEFPRGFEAEHSHMEFLKYIVDKFRKHHLEIQFSNIMTLDDVWESNKRLLLGYYHQFDGINYELWTFVHQQWGNVRSVEQLENFVNLTETSAELEYRNSFPAKSLRAVMAEITLDSSMIVADAAAYYFGCGRKSLRELAVETGPLITIWYKERYSKTANIVAVDFLDTTGIVEVAIHSNIIRAKSAMSNN